MYRAIAAAALALVVSTAVSTGDAEDCATPEALLKSSPARAVAACRRLAAQGNARAQNNLGFIYNNGYGVPQDYKEALKWYRLAAEQGDAMPQYNLGLIYKNGHGVSQDYKEAAKWLRKAAEQGHSTAQKNLGGMYALGHGVLQDYVLAHMWLNLAAAQGDDGAQRIRDSVAELMTPTQIEEAQRLAREWKPKVEN